jgi:hypothetical protein
MSFDPSKVVQYGACAHQRQHEAIMTGNAPTFATLLLRVFLPFALAYFL